jgi:DnaJ-class molecular chaperone
VNFNEIDEARRLLGLGGAATMKEIKSAYRRLSHRYHPDKHDDASQANDEMMKKLNLAYRLLLDYCNNYRYSFDEEDVARNCPHEEGWRKWRESWRM